jgi:dihydroorotate dehydrogenase
MKPLSRVSAATSWWSDQDLFMLYRRFLRPALFQLANGDPEGAHERVLSALAWISHSPLLTAALSVSAAVVGGKIPGQSAREVFGLRFPHPVGLAAGFDKNALAIPALAALGFGFVEVGTVTRGAQPGNPRPRLFRLPADQGLINRMGFNNEGAPLVAAHLAAMQSVSVPIGVSLGKSRATPLENAVEDYAASLEALYAYGDYFAVNVSSPNTPGLRALQEADRLDTLLQALVGELGRLARREVPPRARPKPLLVKIAPDLDDASLEQVADVCLARGASGLIAVNTTTARDGLRAPSRAVSAEEGGLSGRPLRQRALSVTRKLYERCGDRLPIIGCGGIFATDDALRMLDAGAALVQIYTSFIYEGPLIARRIARGLDRNGRRARKDQIIGTHANSQI